MKYILFATLATITFLEGVVQAIKAETPDIPEERFELSGPIRTQKWPVGGWNGRYSYSNVYCVEFPAPTTIRQLDRAMFVPGGFAYARAYYPDDVTISIIVSSVPGGKTAEAEIASTLGNEKQSQRAHDQDFELVQYQTAFGPTLGFTGKNIFADAPGGPYPLVKWFYKPIDDKIHSLGVERVFVRGPDRFEVGVLQDHAPQQPVSEQMSAAMKRNMIALADQVVDSLQSCTAKLPLRSTTSSTAAQATPDSLDRAIAYLFDRWSQMTLCLERSETRDSVRAALTERLRGVDVNSEASAHAVSTAIYTTFPCPFSPYRPELRPAKRDDLIGEWSFPESSKQLRYGPKAPEWKMPPATIPKCEWVTYLESGELTTIQFGGTNACPTISNIRSIRQKMPKVETWTLVRDGRVKVVRKDIPDHIEEWDIFVVETAFDFANARFEPGELVAYLRKLKTNEVNASTMFRHLRRVE